jgi:hypothetical protein
MAAVLLEAGDDAVGGGSEPMEPLVAAAPLVQAEASEAEPGAMELVDELAAELGLGGDGSLPAPAAADPVVVGDEVADREQRAARAEERIQQQQQQQQQQEQEEAAGQAAETAAEVFEGEGQERLALQGRLGAQPHSEAVQHGQWETSDQAAAVPQPEEEQLLPASPAQIAGAAAPSHATPSTNRWQGGMTAMRQLARAEQAVHAMSAGVDPHYRFSAKQMHRLLEARRQEAESERGRWQEEKAAHAEEVHAKLNMAKPSKLQYGGRRGVRQYQRRQAQLQLRRDERQRQGKQALRPRVFGEADMLAGAVGATVTSSSSSSSAAAALAAALAAASPSPQPGGGLAGLPAGVDWYAPDPTVMARNREKAALNNRPVGFMSRTRGLGGGAAAASSLPGHAAAAAGADYFVSRAFPSWNRSILTDIYLCQACSDHAIEHGNARIGGRVGLRWARRGEPDPPAGGGGGASSAAAAPQPSSCATHGRAGY